MQRRVTSDTSSSSSGGGKGWMRSCAHVVHQQAAYWCSLSHLRLLPWHWMLQQKWQQQLLLEHVVDLKPLQQHLLE
jgi:hypothetical protein